MRHPIVLLWVLVVIGFVWMFFTQILLPIFDSRLPLFPWFRKSRWEDAKALIAAEDLESAQEDLRRAENELKIMQKVDYVTPPYQAKERALRRRIENAKIAVKDAEERVEKYTKEPKEAEVGTKTDH